MSVVKRRKTSHYAQIHNDPLQGGLKDLRAVGLLSHIMSLPETWELHKTQLHSCYTRRNVDAGWKELAEKGYAIGFCCHKDGKKDYFYSVSDVPFAQEEFEDYVLQEIEELQDQGSTVTNLSSILHSSFEITDRITDKTSDVRSVHQKVKADTYEVSSDVLSVQHSVSSTESAYIKKKINKEISIKEIINNNNNMHIDTREKIDQELQNEFPDIPLEEVKEDMEKNHSYLTDTDNRYRGSLKKMITDRIQREAMESNKPKRQHQPKKKNNQREEKVPEWFGKQKKKEAAPAINSNIDEERRKLLEELGIQQN